MITVKCTYENGDTITTGFNGTFEHAEFYFLGEVFNIGSVNDNMQKCVNVELVGKTEMNRQQLIKMIVPALKQHWEHTHGRQYSEEHIQNAIKGNPKPMLLMRYNSLKQLGYIK